MRSGEVAVAAARALVGARFRPRGRDAAHGLDCVGVAGIAYDVAVPGGYAMRGAEAGDLEARIVAAGFRRVGEADPGDLLLIDAGAGQLHLAVRTDAGLVQAHAGLARVVETPGVPGQVLATFRPGED